LLTTKLPSTNKRASILNACGETKREQHAHAIGVDQKPSSQSVPSLLALNEFRREAVPVKGGGSGETGYASADDQDRLDRCHGSFHRGVSDRQRAAPQWDLSWIGACQSWTRRNTDWDQSEIVR
jgi:hypothetical protein